MNDAFVVAVLAILDRFASRMTLGNRYRLCGGSGSISSVGRTVNCKDDSPMLIS